MLLFCDSVQHYTTAQIGDKYTAVSSVTVVPAAGRLGGPALFFDASIPASLTQDLSPSALGSGGHLFTCGFALKPVTIGNAVPTTLLRLTLSNADVYTVQMTPTHQLQIRYTGDPVVLVASPVNTLTPGVGCYVEIQIDLNKGTGIGQVILRVNGAVVATAVAPVFSGVSYTNVIVGGGSAEVGTWYLCDLYIVDGNTAQPVGGVTKTDGTVVTLGGFLGNISVQCFLPTQNGLNLAVANTPWTPVFGSSNVAMVNALQAVDSVAVFNGGHPTGNLDSYQFASPRAGAVLASGLYGFAGATPWPVYAVQWVARVKSAGGSPQVAPMVRRVVAGGGTLRTDIVVEGPTLTITDVDYAFAVVPFSGDPTNGNRAWQLPNTFLNPTSASRPTDVELGIQKLVGVS